MNRMKLRSAVCLAALASAGTVTPAYAGDKEAWRDCMALCALVAFWPPGVAAWAAGCTGAYLTDCALNGQRKAARFNTANGYAAGTETILYTPGDTVTLSASVWNDELMVYTDPEAVASVQFRVIDLNDLYLAGSFDGAPWQSVGSGDFNGGNLMWETDWTPNVIPVAGWAIRADFTYVDGYPSEVPTTALNSAGLIPAPAAVVPIFLGMALMPRRRR
ncbi:MAG: hypothetical protein JNK58_02285 [Phycisphaerae bacterium]|nr:hypothetical protein [Phycisphaerae bacterium]